MPEPSLAIVDATIWPGAGRPEAEAIAVWNGRITQVGTTDEIRAQAGPNTDIFDAEGRFVMPGFVDCHTHAARLGELRFRQDLSNVPGKDEALQILSARAKKTPEGGWVIGWNWDENAWPDTEPITPEDLDRVSTQHKVLARRVCGHRVVVNSTALEAIDLDEATPGATMREGEITGKLSEDAAVEAWEACAPAHETCVKGLKLETRRLAELGITSIADTASKRDVRLLTQGAQEGWMLQRSGIYVMRELLDHVEALGLGPISGPRCSILGVKMYTDGSLGARTAALREPYEDEDHTGELLLDAEEIAKTATRAAELGLQPKAHAIGDRAIDAVLDGYEQADLDPALRPRLEHAELSREDQIERMAELDVVCVMQPNFVANWQAEDGLYETALGEERTRQMNPFKSVLDAGVDLAFSSDGMPYGPLEGIQGALEHPNPNERLTIDQALHAYTRGAAYALGAEMQFGTLAEGGLGDAIVLAEDPRETDTPESVEIDATILGGQRVV